MRVNVRAGYAASIGAMLGLRLYPLGQDEVHTFDKGARFQAPLGQSVNMHHTPTRFSEVVPVSDILPVVLHREVEVEVLPSDCACCWFPWTLASGDATANDNPLHVVGVYSKLGCRSGAPTWFLTMKGFFLGTLICTTTSSAQAIWAVCRQDESLGKSFDRFGTVGMSLT